MTDELTNQPDDDAEDDFEDTGIVHREDSDLEELRKVLAHTERKSVTGAIEPDLSLLGYNGWGDVGPLSGHGELDE